jgi:hypothetical protein
MVYIDFLQLIRIFDVVSSLKSPRYNSNFSWNPMPCDYTKYAEDLQLNWYLFSSANYRMLGSTIISMKTRLNLFSFLIIHSVNNKALNVFTALYICTF